MRLLLPLLLVLGLGAEPAHAGVYAAGAPLPGNVGRNGVSDVAAAACDLDVGCFTSTGARCADTPDQRCDLQVTPLGRCSRGSGPCIWPSGAGFCQHDGGGTPVDPVPCLTDSYLAFLEQGGLNPGSVDGPSLMCADVRGGNGVCEMSTSDPSCDCTGTDPDADLANGDPDVPSWEGVVCGLADPQATCSDGDPLRRSAGDGMGVCNESCSFGPCTVSVGCGDVHTSPGAIVGPRFASSENPPDAFTPQRRPGSGLSLPSDGGPMRAPLRSSAIDVDDPGTGDFAGVGVRRMRFLSNSAFSDEVFFATGGGQSSESWYACEIPGSWGWSTELPISGSCTDNPELFCVTDQDCFLGTCDPSSFVYCHDADDDPHSSDPIGFDGTGFLWTRALDPAEQTGQCPGDCRRGYAFDAFEFDALRDAFASGDPRAGTQLFLDNLEGARVGAGDAIAALRFVVSVVLFASDPRCYVGGDPGRSDPTDAAVGRCQSGPEPCDPQLPHGANGCPTTEACLYCGGTPSAAPHPQNTSYRDFGGNRGFDPLRGSPTALPVGFDTHGLAALSLRGRVGRLNTIPSSYEIPVWVLLAPGPTRATFTDDTCSSTDGCALGQVAGGAPGIGPSERYFDAGAPVPHEPNAAAPGYLVSLTVPPADPGAPLLGDLVVPADVAPGPDGIPGCIGDNFDGTTCDERLGDPGAPGSTGADDTSILYDFSPLGDGSDLRTGTQRRAGLSSDPLAFTPAWSASASFAVRDLFTFSPSDFDVVGKLEWSFCLLEPTLVCSSSDLDGDGWLDEQDGCPLNPSLALGPDSGGVASGADPGGHLPDGILDECQCGDVSDDGRVTGTDAAFIVRACLNAAPFESTLGCAESQVAPVPFRHDKCDVGGSGGSGACSGIDGTFVRFASLGLPPGLDLRCPAYMPGPAP